MFFNFLVKSASLDSKCNLNFFLILIRILLLFFSPLLIFSQEESQSRRFDSIYYEIAVNVSSSNPTKALHLADSLSIYALNKKQKIKALILTADILSKQDKKGESIIQAQKALDAAIQEKDYVFQSRIYGFLSTEYRSIGFIDQGKNFLNKGIEISKLIPDKNKVANYLAKSNQELALYAFEEEDYIKSIDYLNLAILTLKKTKDLQTRYFTLSSAEESLGYSFKGLGKMEKAIMHFSKAKSYINNAGAGNTIWAASIYNGLANTYLKLNKIDSAGIYIEKALSISEDSDNGSLKEQIYKTASEYYEEIDELDSFVLYNSKFIDQLEENTEKKRLMINSAHNALNFNSENNNNFIIIIIIILIITALLIFLFFTYYLKRSFIPKIKTLKTNNNITSDIVLSKKTKYELEVKLKEFEESNGFLDKNISLPTLIGLLNTNTKYFRQFLKTTKNTDYINYINELRIHYILNKLKTDKKYLNYKISYLADEGGFSSHSKFSASFKNVTGFCPSEYIEDIKNSI